MTNCNGATSFLSSDKNNGLLGLQIRNEPVFLCDRRFEMTSCPCLVSSIYIYLGRSLFGFFFFFFFCVIASLRCAMSSYEGGCMYICVPAPSFDEIKHIEFDNFRQERQ